MEASLFMPQKWHATPFAVSIGHTGQPQYSVRGAACRYEHQEVGIWELALSHPNGTIALQGLWTTVICWSQWVRMLPNMSSDVRPPATNCHRTFSSMNADEKTHKQSLAQNLSLIFRPALSAVDTCPGSITPLGLPLAQVNPLASSFVKWARQYFPRYPVELVWTQGENLVEVACTPPSIWHAW